MNGAAFGERVTRMDEAAQTCAGDLQSALNLQLNRGRAKQRPFSVRSTRYFGDVPAGTMG